MDTYLEVPDREPETGDPMPGLSDPGPMLERVAMDLSSRFRGIFAQETVQRFVTESFSLLAATAAVRTYTPVLAGRFAAERLTAVAQSSGKVAKKVPEVLFVCVQNAGRSQMAAALLSHLGHGKVHARSAGSFPAAVLDRQLLVVMAEVGIEMDLEFPKPLTDEVVMAADVVVTMGCGDACAVYPGKQYLDWDLPDPDQMSLPGIRAVRDEITTHVTALLGRLSSIRVG